MFGPKGLEFRRFFKEGKVVSIASRNLVSCTTATSVGSVINLMLEGKRKIPVTNSSGELKGIITVNDILDYAGLGDRHEMFSKNPLKLRVGKIMNTRVVSVNASSSIEKAFSFFKEYRRGSFPLVRSGKVVGMIADWDFMKGVRGNVGVSVGELMIRKPAQAKESYSILDVARIMVRGGYRRLPVTKSGILTGIVLPTDLLSHLHSGEGISSMLKDSRTISRIMKTSVKTTNPEADVGEAIRTMLASKSGGLPVVEDEELVGIITESDVVQALA